MDRVDSITVMTFVGVCIPPKAVDIIEDLFACECCSREHLLSSFEPEENVFFPFLMPARMRDSFHLRTDFMTLFYTENNFYEEHGFVDVSRVSYKQRCLDTWQSSYTDEWIRFVDRHITDEVLQDVLEHADDMHPVFVDKTKETRFVCGQNYTLDAFWRRTEDKPERVNLLNGVTSEEYARTLLYRLVGASHLYTIDYIEDAHTFIN